MDAFVVSIKAAGKAIPAQPNATAYCSYQQNGKTLAIRQPNDQFAGFDVFRVFLGEGTAVSVAFRSACDCGDNSARYLAVTALSEEKVRLVLAPSISNPEFDRISTLKQRCHLGLVEVCEHRDGPSIMAKSLEPPPLCSK